MMMKMLCASRAATLEDYRKAVRQRANLLWGLAVLGLLTLAVTLLWMNGQIAEEGDTAYLQGIWCGIGSGLTIAGALMALRTRRLLKNETALREAMLEEQDERNIAINQRALGTAAGLGVLLLYLALLAFSFIDRTICQTLSACGVIFFLLFLGAKAFYRRRM